MVDLNGLIVPMVTPFKSNEDLDEAKLRELTRWLVEKGVHGLFPLSSTGEAQKLSMEESKKIIDIVVDEANGKVPVVPGTGLVSTRHTMELNQYAKDVGADASVVVTPYFYRLSDEAIFEHYKIIAEKIDFPIILYDVPVLCNLYSLQPELVARLATLTNVIGIKDGSGSLIKLAKEIELVGDRIAVIQGDDLLFLPSLVIGSPGLIGALGNIIPHFMIEMYNAFRAGDIEKAVSMHKKLTPLAYLIEKLWWIGSVKESLNVLGFNVGYPRKPAEQITDQQRNKLRKVLSNFRSNISEIK